MAALLAGAAATALVAETPAPAPVERHSPRDGYPSLGPASAANTLIFYTDYQCPVCRRAIEPLKLLVRSYPTELALVVKQAVSPRHAMAADASAAALAAFRQGRFWAYQDRIFGNQSALSAPELTQLARATGLDVEAFGRELEAPAIRGQVQYETALAEHLDLAATPSFVVNGHVQRGWGSYRGLEAVVTRELARAQSVAAEGIPPARVAYEATRRAGPDGERLAAALFEPPDTV